MKKRRFHLNRHVRWLADKKCWIVTIGRNVTADGKLADRDWYFPGHLRQDHANRLATEKAQQWEVICRNWHRTDEPLLVAFAEPFAAEPRWNTACRGNTPRILTPEQIKEFRREDRVDDDEMIESMADDTLGAFIDFYAAGRRDELADKVLRGTSQAKLVKQMRLAATYFPDDIPARRLLARHFGEAKKRMFESLGRRTTSNYLKAAYLLLEFIYATYMGGLGLPAGLADAVIVKGANSKSIKTYTLDEVKGFLRDTKGTLSQLDLMLDLNCGMNPQDIGRLLLTEIDLHEESAMWDREKEPLNDFRLHHMFWPETSLLVKHWLNDGRNLGLPVTDYRYGRENPVEVCPSDLAFLDHGRPRYWVAPGGSEKNRVSDLLRKTVSGVTFVPLRKTANNWFIDRIEKDDDMNRALAAGELSDRFLGHGTDSLRRTYSSFGKTAYTTMNRYLIKMGDWLREQGLFEHVTI